MSVLKVKFVSRKVSKIRWKPKSTSIFITGSYDDDDNNLSLWYFPNNTVKELDDEEMLEENDPVAIQTEKFSGSVTDLKVVSDEIFFAASSTGSLSMYRYSDENMECINTLNKVHCFKTEAAAATAIDAKGKEIASVGEDGRLCVFNYTHLQKIKDIECSDRCAFTAVTYLRHQEIVAGNSLGYLRIWDLRSPTNNSTSTLVHSRNQSGISSMTSHPAQSHVLMTGNEDGSMHVWDMRQEKQPVAVLEGHFCAVRELLFHSTHPDFLFTCSSDGSVLQWDASLLRNNYGTPHHLLSTPTGVTNQNAANNPWLSCETNKHRLEITSLFSQPVTCVNSIDFSGSTLLWVTDNESVHICTDIVV